MNFGEALIEAKNGEEITRDAVHWTLKLQDGKFFCKTTGKLIPIQNIDNHNILANDWRIVTPETYLTDLKPGDRFKTIGDAIFMKTSQKDNNGVQNYFVDLSNGQSHQVIGKLKVEKVK